MDSHLTAFSVEQIIRICLNDSILIIICSFFLFQNKSAFLCGVMKTYRQREKQGTKVSDTNKGPDEAKIKVRTAIIC